MKLVTKHVDKQQDHADEGGLQGSGKHVRTQRRTLLLHFQLLQIHDQLDGLTYMEIEFPTEEEANNFQAPEWLGKDVTNDKNYNNTAYSM